MTEDHLSLTGSSVLTESILCARLKVDYMGEEAYAWTFRPIKVSTHFAFSFSPNWALILASDPLDQFFAPMFNQLDALDQKINMVIANLRMEYNSGTAKEPDLADLVEALAASNSEWWIGSYADSPNDYVCARLVEAVLEDALTETVI